MITEKLGEACWNGNLEVIKDLVENGADIHNFNDWPLTVAAYCGHLKVVKYLVEKGADIHSGDDRPLENAARNGHLEIVNYLRKIAGDKWKCYKCLVRVTCLNLCEDWNKI